MNGVVMVDVDKLEERIREFIGFYTREIEPSTDAALTLLVELTELERALLGRL